MAELIFLALAFRETWCKCMNICLSLQEGLCCEVGSYSCSH